MSSLKKRFRVAFSFSGEKRPFVAQVAAILATRFGERAILYDKFHEAEFARRDLGFYLPELYHSQCDLVVVVVCRDYDSKQWTGLEWTAIHDLLSQRKSGEVLLCRFDHTKVAGLFSTAGFVELDHKTPEQAATLILQRLALNEGLPIDHYLQEAVPHDTTTKAPDRELTAPNSGKNTEDQTGRDLVYISYRHRDKHWQRELRQILDSDPDLVDRVWDDTDIHKGDLFEQEIDRHVARARIMIMLTSADYFGPECGAAECEIKPALEAHAAGLLKILWCPVRRHEYRKTPLARITAATGAGAVAMEDLSPPEQMAALRRIHEEVRRCLDLPVETKARANAIIGLEMVLDCPPTRFDEKAFRQALEGLVGTAVHRIAIVSIREGSTIVTLGGDPEVLELAVRSLKDGQDRLHTFMQLTGLQSFAWVSDGQTYAIQVSPPLSKTAPANPATANRRLVILVHGIRTRAEWQGRIRALLEARPGTVVEALGYGYFDVLRFICPFFTRSAPVKEITEKVRGALHYHRAQFDEVVIVGHSFASYILGEMLRADPTLKIDRVLLCGSVLPRNYRWQQLPNRPKEILNEVGSKDIWPILAHSVTWGYGSSGTFGFQTFGVRDRHHAFTHSEFFEGDFAEKYWLPWILEGRFVPSPYETGERPATPFFKNLLDIVHLKWIALLLAAILIGMDLHWSRPAHLNWSQVDPVSPPAQLANIRGIIIGNPWPLAASPVLNQQLRDLRGDYQPQQQYVSFLSSEFEGKKLPKVVLKIRPEYQDDLAVGNVVLQEAGGTLKQVASIQFGSGFPTHPVSPVEGRVRLLSLLFPLSARGDEWLSRPNLTDFILIQIEP